MVLRHIGEVSVRVDDLEDRDRRLVEASIRLITDINLRDGTQLLAWIISSLLMMIATLVFWLAMKASADQPLSEVEVRYIFGVATAEVCFGYVISLPFAGSAEQRTRLDVMSLYRNMTESSRCRELVAAYREAHPSFHKILERAGGTTHPKTA